MLQALSFDILFMWDRGSLGESPKALEEDTPMWVYGVGPALGYESQKTWGMTYPWVMPQNSHDYIDLVSCRALISNVQIGGGQQFINCERIDEEKQR